MSAGRIAALLVLGLAVLAAGWKVHHIGEVAGRAEIQNKWDAERTAQLAAQVEEGRENARETLRRLTKQQENQRAQNIQIANARRDAAGAADAAERLRERTQAIAAAAGCGETSDTAVECVRAAATRIGDALGSCTKEYRYMADYAADARTRGLKCEADYDALTPSP